MGLHHIFDDKNNINEGRVHIQKHSTINVMDYTTNIYDQRKLFYKFQIEKLWMVSKSEE